MIGHRYAIRPVVEDSTTYYRIWDGQRRRIVRWFASLERARAVLRQLERMPDDAGEAGSWR